MKLEIEKILAEYSDGKETIQEATAKIMLIFIDKESDKERNWETKLRDRLFELANDFAIAKKGDVAVKLHSIHNGLTEKPKPTPIVERNQLIAFGDFARDYYGYSAIHDIIEKYLAGID